MKDPLSPVRPNRDLSAVFAALTLLLVVVVVGVAVTSGLGLTWPAAPIVVFVVGFLAAILVLRRLLRRAATSTEHRFRD